MAFLTGRGPRIRVPGGGGGEKEGWWLGYTSAGGVPFPYVDVDPIFVDDVFVIWAPHLPAIEQLGAVVGFGIGWDQQYTGGGAYRVEITYIDPGNEPGLRFTPQSGDEAVGFLIHLIHGGAARFPLTDLANFPDG